jgi:hypothetical protein
MNPSPTQAYAMRLATGFMPCETMRAEVKQSARVFHAAGHSIHESVLLAAESIAPYAEWQSRTFDYPRARHYVPAQYINDNDLED